MKNNTQLISIFVVQCTHFETKANSNSKMGYLNQGKLNLFSPPSSPPPKKKKLFDSSNRGKNKQTNKAKKTNNETSIECKCQIKLALISTCVCCIQEVTEGLLRLQHWGVVEHHNAMVFDLEVAESPDENEEPKVLDKFIFIYYYYWLVQHFEFVREENVLYLRLMISL